MCGCKKGNVLQNQIVMNNVLPSNNEECEYTIELVNEWKGYLQCISSQNKLSDFNIQKALYNSFLGILLSIQNRPDTICYFEKELDIIHPYIINIINAEIC